MAAPSLPSYQLPGNVQYPMQYFVAEERHSPQDVPLPIGLNSDEQIKSFVSGLWEKSYRAMEPEHARINRLELNYAGFRYKNALENFEKEVTNYPFSVVETVLPELIGQKPRPEIQPGDTLSEANADDLNSYATWLMNTDGFDIAHEVGTREMLKLGWNMNVVVFDPRTGMPYPKPWSNWNFYPDFTAASESDMMYCFLAGPVSTRHLQSVFPGMADKIQSDHWVSPSYDVLVRPYIESMDQSTWSERIVVPHATGPLEPPATTSTELTPPTGSRAYGGDTTFLFQLLVRDMSLQTVGYSGKRWKRDTAGSWTWHWDQLKVPEPYCKGGWRLIQLTAGGTLLDYKELDPAFAGLPFTMGRDYRQAFRFFNPGEVDHILSKARAIDRRLDLLNMALEYEATPTWLTDKNSGVAVDKGAISAGDIVRKKQGTDFGPLAIRSPAEQQFLLLAGERQDVDVISGVHDVLQGQRPPGIEAGVAIGRLQEQGKVRIRGKEGSMFAHHALLLKKLMVGSAMKLNRRIQFRATGGKLVTIDPETLMSEFSIAFAKGSGLLSSRNDRKSEALELFQLGAIDAEELLKAFDWKDRQAILARVQRRQELQMIAAAQAGPQGGAPSGTGGRRAA